MLGGKSLRYEYTEDILTSTVFGTLKYLKPGNGLIPFIESAFLYDGRRTTLWEKLNSEEIELRCYREVDYIFWAWNQNYGEPDLVLLFSDHVHGKDDLLIIVECKFKSGKSGTEENDQLARYFDAIIKDIENFSEAKISYFKGKKGYIVYLTEYEAHSEISETSKIIHSRYNEIENNVFHLRWHQLYKTIEMMRKHFSSYEIPIVEDLMKYLEKLGLRDFSGISLPDESLSSALSSQNPIFFKYEDVSDESKPYFDWLTDLNLSHENNIFYRGELISERYSKR